MPRLAGYESILVVDGLVTDENRSYTVRLSRTIQEQDAIPVKVSDAEVFITDDRNNSFRLMNTCEGIYKTDSIEFRGSIGNSYVLHIICGGEEYESESCLMQSVPAIDSIYYSKEQVLSNNSTETHEGIRIYLDSEKSDNNKYYRWDFEETWKFRVPTPKKYDYINEFNIAIIPESQVNEFCWKSRKSDELLIDYIYDSEHDRIEKEPLFFIASDKSDRLMIHYSILVSQYSVSKNEFEFWENLKKVNESGEDIFSSIPFPVISNIHNINNTKDRVLGYFQVSAVKQMRKEIPFSEIVELDLPFYEDPCIRIEDSPNIYPWNRWNPPLTWDDIYYMYISSGYTFVEPKYLSGSRELDRLIFTSPECTDCEITGTLTKPDFWVNIN